ncbi:MAG: AraC family transcriptional regulator [Spirochaetales bacterium]|nr:AraC family transcriptional regulator [Spirochaetales bacterium]
MNRLFLMIWSLMFLLFTGCSNSECKCLLYGGPYLPDPPFPAIIYIKKLNLVVVILSDRSVESHYYLFSREIPYEDSDSRIVLLGDLVCTPDYFKDFHTHSAIEICLITEGRGSFFIGEEEYAVKPGNIFLTHPMQVHRSKADAFAPYRMYYLAFNIAEDSVFSPMYKQLARMDKHLVVDQYNLSHFFGLLVAEMLMQEEGAEAAIRSLFHTIIVYLHRNFLVDRLKVTKKITSRHLLIQKVVAIVEKDFEKGLDLKSIAGQIGYTPSYLSRIFKQQMGKSLSQYWNQLRMSRARMYIHSEPDKTLQEISRMVGIEDYHYFSRLFKLYCGHSPTEERKSQNNPNS